MTTVAKSTAQSITAVLGTVSTTANVVAETVGMVGTAVNGATLKLNDWHYEQKKRSIQFRDELDERLEQEEIERTKLFAKEVRKTQQELDSDPELKEIFNKIRDARTAKRKAEAEAAEPK